MSRVSCPLLALAVLGATGLPARESPQQGAEKKDQPRKVEHGLALHYTFAGRTKNVVKDVAATGHESKITKGLVVKTDRSPAVEFKGDGYIEAARSPKLDPAGTALVVAAWCYSGSNRGLVAALGGEKQGRSLYLKDGVPTFAVRSANVLKEARGEDAIGRGRWVHRMGVLEAGGKMRVWVDGKPAGDSVQSALIKETPEDGLCVGADTGSRAGDYKDAQHWRGKLREVKSYRGAVAAKELQRWAGLKE